MMLARRGVLEQVVVALPVALPHELPGAGILRRLLLRRRWEELLLLLLVWVMVVPAEHGGDLVLRRREVVEGDGAGGGGRVGRAGGGAEGDGERGEVRRDGPGAGGGDDGGLGLLQQPLDGLAVGLVAQLPRELEHPRRAQRRHPYPAPAALHLGVAVLGGPFAPRSSRGHHGLRLVRSSAGRSCRRCCRRRRRLLLLLRQLHIHRDGGRDGPRPHELRHPGRAGSGVVERLVPRRLVMVVVALLLLLVMMLLLGGAPAAVGARARAARRRVHASSCFCLP
uniref:Uncharacterized protein n=1 Tax=Zea mays TaxID=4577 RepID=A0A804P124_MAIZE